MKLIILILFVATGFSTYWYFTQTPNKTSHNDLKKTVLEEVSIELAKHLLTEINVEIQVPANWQLYKEMNNNQFAYYFTPYRFEDFNKFLRGVSIISAKDCKKTTGINSDDQAKEYVGNAQKMDPDLKVITANHGKINVYSFTIQDREKGPEQKTHTIFFYADQEKDILLTVVFQFETQQWENIFPLRKTIAESIKLL